MSECKKHCVKEDFNTNREEIQKFIADSVDWLIEEQMGCCTYKLDNRLAVCVGWSEGYGEDDGKYVILSTTDPEFGITAGIKVWTSDDMRTDFDWINFPYFEDGDVYDISISIGEAAKEDNYKSVVDYLMDEYEDVKDKYIDKDGKIIETEQVIDDEEDIEVEDDDSIDESKGDKRINLTKYGFKRCPEEDFVDDGQKFQCYKTSDDSEMYISKTISDGDIYLSGHLYKGNLPYNVYQKLDHYDKVLWDLNGISVNDITDEDLKNFYNDCVAYEKEYNDALEKFNSTKNESCKGKTIKESVIRGMSKDEMSKVMENIVAYRLDGIFKFDEPTDSFIEKVVKRIIKENEFLNYDAIDKVISDEIKKVK